mgnify:CR=1 FL=1
MGLLDALTNANPIASAVEGGVSGFLGTIGKTAKELREAFTGEAIIDANKAAELALKSQELESAIERGRLSVMVAEASSQDKWTSRGRPMFLYVMYVFILFAIPMGILSAFRPDISTQIANGAKAWLQAIPSDMWWLFGAGYLGYTTARTADKIKGKAK